MPAHVCTCTVKHVYLCEPSLCFVVRHLELGRKQPHLLGRMHSLRRVPEWVRPRRIAQTAEIEIGRERETEANTQRERRGERERKRQRERQGESRYLYIYRERETTIQQPRCRALGSCRFTAIHNYVLRAVLLVPGDKSGRFGNVSLRTCHDTMYV